MNENKSLQMPTAGGRYTRDPKSGELKQVQGPKPDAEINKARSDAKAQTANTKGD
jgi:hypothetical protein